MRCRAACIFDWKAGDVIVTLFFAINLQSHSNQVLSVDELEMRLSRRRPLHRGVVRV